MKSSLTHDSRIRDIRTAMAEAGLDAYMVTHLPTIRYITNFSGSNATLIITKRAVHFFTDDRYTEQIKAELFPLDGLKTAIERDVFGYITKKKLLKDGSQLGYESNVLSVDMKKSIAKQLKGVKLTDAPNLARNTTIVKSATEIAHIKKAADIAAQAYDYILGFVKPGMRELDAAIELSYQARKFGSEGDAFETIFVAGEHGAFPHGRAGTRKLKKGDVITLDFGCKWNGFNSDMTRVFSIGKPSSEAMKAWDVVTEAHKRAIESISAGMSAKTLDLTARDIITNAGYGKYFGHSLGHGLGIEVHEMPGVSHRNEKGVIPEGCVITIEPGIYVPGEFGMRLEDDIHVTADGPVYLTSSRRDMVRL
ncbi:MAG: aminopeptidase P family protein [Candidatus Kapabacteria bacterium]|nr:aminopeptidase P family protein [Candidatus Kapabacteria bacterium]